MTINDSAYLLRRSKSAGFTLVEMAVVVTIMALLLAMGLSAANSVMQSTQRTVSQQRLDAARDALISYFTVNHRFPCPENTPAVLPDGAEDRVGVACTSSFGTLPYLTLGIGREAALDGYGNYLSYRLDTASNWHLLTAFTPIVGVCPADNPPVKQPATLMVYSAVATTETAAAPDAAAFVLISHGKNGLGAWNQATALPARNLPLPATAGEFGNTQLVPAGPAGYRKYVFSDTAAAPFDDLVVWAGFQQIKTVFTNIKRADICS